MELLLPGVSKHLKASSCSRGLWHQALGWLLRLVVGPHVGRGCSGFSPGAQGAFHGGVCSGDGTRDLLCCSPVANTLSYCCPPSSDR